MEKTRRAREISQFVKKKKGELRTKNGVLKQLWLTVRKLSGNASHRNPHLKASPHLKLNPQLLE
jgi:hypothetical protein